MPDTQTLKDTIRHHAQTAPVREHSGNALRDTTYGDMISAGLGLRRATSSAAIQRNAKALALGIEAWSPDTTVFSATAVALLEAGAGRDPYALADLMDPVAGYEEADAGDQEVYVALQQAQRALGVPGDAVTAPSLLLHCLSPGYLPCLGRRVARALDREHTGLAPSATLYASYAASLRGLGLTDHLGGQPEITAFGDASEAAATRLRRVDCTLWHVGGAT